MPRTYKPVPKLPKVAYLKQGRFWSRSAKIAAVKKFLEYKKLYGDRHGTGWRGMSAQIGCSWMSLRNWVKTYEKEGEKGFPYKTRRKSHNPFRLDRVLAKQKLSPKDIATIRYGMAGLTNAQVGAYFGKGASYIKRIRAGIVGGRLVAPVPLPAAVTRAEANLWFVHKAKAILEAWTAALDRINREGDKANVDDLLEGKLEPVETREVRALAGTGKHHRTYRRRAAYDGDVHDQGRPAVDQTTNIPGNESVIECVVPLDAPRPDHAGRSDQAPGTRPDAAQPISGGAGGAGKGAPATGDGWVRERRRG